MNLYRYISTKIALSQKSRFLRFARLVSFVSVMLGVIALLLSLAILYGFENELKNATTKFTSHIVVYNYNKDVILNANNICQDILSKFPEVKNIQSVIEREGLIRSKNHIDGVLIKSFNPKNDINKFKNNFLSQNNLFSTDTAFEIIIGTALLNKLGLDIGDEVILYTTDGDKKFTTSKIRKFKIVNSYKTGMIKYDESLVFIPENTARLFLNLPQHSANKIEIVLHDISKAQNVSSKIMNFLGYPFWTLTYYEIHSSLFAWIELQREPIPLVLGIISLVAMLNIITTLIITVTEKTRTIGILRTLGLSKSGIIKIFLFQGLQIGFLGVLAGCIVSFTFSILQLEYNLIHLKGEIYYLDSLPIFISPIHYILVSSITLILVVLASIVPAIIASKITPVRAIRFR